MQNLCQHRPRILPLQEAARPDSSLSALPPQGEEPTTPRYGPNSIHSEQGSTRLHAARTPTKGQIQSRRGKGALFVRTSCPHFVRTTVLVTRALRTARPIRDFDGSSVSDIIAVGHTNPTLSSQPPSLGVCGWQVKAYCIAPCRAASSWPALGKARVSASLQVTKEDRDEQQPNAGNPQTHSAEPP